jgi:glucokinase
MTLACGVDVGGTKIAGGIVDDTGRILEELLVESPATDVHAIEAAVEKLVTELRTRHDIAAVGVGAAGYIDRSRSVVLFAPNLAWRDLDLKADLERRLGLPVVVENDANAAAWGEFQFGAGHDVDDLLLVTVGTGVGGGVVLDGSLYRGAFGVGAEIGTCASYRTGSAVAAVTVAASRCMRVVRRSSARRGQPQRRAHCWQRTSSIGRGATRPGYPDR